MSIMSTAQNNKTHPIPRGFTLVELLIVIVVIAILAALSYVGYTAISNRALSSTLQSDLSQAAKQLGVAKIDNNDAYPNPTLPPNIKASDGNTFEYTSDGQSYCLSITSAKSSSLSYHINSSTNSTTPQAGVCAGHAGPIAGGGGGSGAIADGALMQTITDANCPTERTMAVDARDNHTYWVQKLGEGANARCWMLTNLAYAGGGTNTYNDTIPTGDGTNGTLHGPDNSGSTTYTLAKYYIPTGANPTTNPTQPSTDTTGGGSGAGRQYGYLYNWCAAMGAQNGGSKPNTSACANATTPAPNTAISICPANWRLPTGQATTGDFTLLNNAVNSASTTTDAGLRSEWLAQRSGYWYSGFDYQGSYGYYWSSTQFSATTGRYLLFGSSFVNPSSSYNKYFGFAVRCVAS